MTRKQFEKIEEREGFNNAMAILSDTNGLVTTYDILKEFAINLLNEDNVGFALHILEAIYDTDINSEWYYYDYTAGTTCTPTNLVDIEDVDSFIGFDEEEVA